jgi:hypothetical protein
VGGEEAWGPVAEGKAAVRSVDGDAPTSDVLDPPPLQYPALGSCERSLSVKVTYPHCFHLTSQLKSHPLLRF